MAPHVHRPVLFYPDPVKGQDLVELANYAIMVPMKFYSQVLTFLNATMQALQRIKKLFTEHLKETQMSNQVLKIVEVLWHRETPRSGLDLLLTDPPCSSKTSTTMFGTRRKLLQNARCAL